MNTVMAVSLQEEESGKRNGGRRTTPSVKTENGLGTADKIILLGKLEVSVDSLATMIYGMLTPTCLSFSISVVRSMDSVYNH